MCETQEASMTCCCFCGVFQSVSSGSMCITCRIQQGSESFHFIFRTDVFFPYVCYRRGTAQQCAIHMHPQYIHMHTQYILYCMYSTVQYITTLYSTVQYYLVQHSTLLPCTAQYITTLYSTTQYYLVIHNYITEVLFTKS